jgi:hypothetical protein
LAGKRNSLSATHRTINITVRTDPCRIRLPLTYMRLILQGSVMTVTFMVRCFTDKAQKSVAVSRQKTIHIGWFVRVTPCLAGDQQRPAVC